MLERASGIEVGAHVVLRVRIGPLRHRWISEHRVYDQDRYCFRDTQVKGPFAHWDHTHRVEPVGPSTCILEDRIEYLLPLGPIGNILGGSYVRRKLARMFDYRQRVTAQDIAAHRQRGSATLMTILVTGASGLVGSALVPFLATGGHQVIRLVRPQSAHREGGVLWDPSAGRLDASSLERVDAVVHLAGENVAGGRWTAERKAEIRDSRVQGTRLLCESLARLARPPKVVVCASAVGYYGDRGDERLIEESAPGSGFLAEVCRAWEAAAEPAVRRGIRVVNLRIGVVLSPAGGALAKLLPLFQIGAGGTLGSGAQYMSWVSIDDVIGAVHHALMTEGLRGPVNVVAPEPVTNREFTRTLGRVLARPTLLPAPAFALRLVLGEMADEALLASARVAPSRLLATGYAFRSSHLEGALRHLLGR